MKNCRKMSENTNELSNNENQENFELTTETFESNNDHLISAQEKQIEKEIAENIDLVGQRVLLAQVVDEYATDDHIYRQKFSQLQENYRYIRKTRPDGNCFFRAFSFAYFEYLLSDKQEFDRFWPYAQEIKDKLVELNFPKFTIEDFDDAFIDVLKKISEGIKTEDLVNTFNESAVSDYLVVYFRLITSGHLQRNNEFFANFIDGLRTVEEFCKQEVEPMYKESDHIHVIALSNEFKVGVRIVYMDRGEGEKANTHDFGIEDGSTEAPKIHLLYRPGHYDILYPNE